MKLTEANAMLSETSYMDFSPVDAGRLIIQHLGKSPSKFFVSKDIHALLVKELGKVTINQCASVLNKLVSNKKIHSTLVLNTRVYRYSPIIDNLTIRDISLSGISEKIPSVYIVNLFLSEHSDSIFCAEELREEIAKWCEANKIRPIIPSVKNIQRFPRIILGKYGNLKAFYGSSEALDKFAQVCEKAGRKYSRRNAQF